VKNNSTERNAKMEKRVITSIILGVLVVMVVLICHLAPGKDNKNHDTAIKTNSSKKNSTKKVNSSSIKVDPIEFYNAPDNKIMPHDDGTITIEGKTAPNKRMELNVSGFVDSETGDITGDVQKSVLSDKNGYFKFDFGDVKDQNLVDILYCLDEKGSTNIDVTNDSYEYSNKHLKLLKNENVDYESFRNLHAKQHHGSHSSSDSSITIDAEITFE